MTYDVALAVKRAVGTCSFCGTKVRWLMTPGGMVIAVNPESSSYGRIVEGPPLIGTVLLAGEDPPKDAVLLREHFPSCPKSPMSTALAAAERAAAAGTTQTRCDSCEDVVSPALVAAGFDRHPSCPPPRPKVGGVAR